MMMKNYAYGSNEVKSREMFISVMKKFMMDYGMHVILLPMWTKEIDYLKIIANEVNNELGKDTHTQVVCRSLSFVPDITFFPSLMGQAYATFGYRLHIQIMSVAYKVPLLALAYGFKTMDFMDMVGLSEYVLRVDQLSSSNFFTKFKRLESMRSHVVKKMEHAISFSLENY